MTGLMPLTTSRFFFLLARLFFFPDVNDRPDAIRSVIPERKGLHPLEVSESSQVDDEETVGQGNDGEDGDEDKDAAFNEGEPRGNHEDKGAVNAVNAAE
jgi:hypothetical protein